jgi:hypothetical protein
VSKLGVKMSNALPMSVVLVKGYQARFRKLLIYSGEGLSLSFILLEKIPKLRPKMSVVLVKGYQECYRKKVILKLPWRDAISFTYKFFKIKIIINKKTGRESVAGLPGG